MKTKRDALEQLIGWQRPWYYWAVLPMLLAGVFSGCREKEQASPSAATQPVDRLEIVLTTPKDAALSTLRCLQAQRAARAQGNEAQLSYCRERLREMAARDVILKRHSVSIKHQAPNQDEILDRFIRGWGPIIGAEIDSLRFDLITTPTPTAELKHANVLVPVSAEEADAVLRLECVRGADNLWRVARIDWQVRRITATQPASKPSP
ncbi:MAG: hypothetical protein ABIG44_12235 [Planctomycetota bacterium]